jgi:hypothetical protein
MNKIVVILGGVCIFLGIIAAIIGLASSMDFEPEENILHNTKTDGSTFGYDRDTVIVAVYAVGDVGCKDFEVTIIDDGYDFFERDCDDYYDTLDYTYLGEADLRVEGNYEIESSGDIVLVSQDSIGGYGLVMIGGGGCCFIGVILLIVGLVIGKNKVSQGQMIILQNPGDLQQFGIDMPVQQPQIGTQQPNSTVPTNQPIVNPVGEQSTGSLPPIPAEGLPPGWDMQQWNNYGHDWLRQQGRA